MEYNITITEGGERLYIHPIAVDYENIRNNKILYLQGEEFFPYENDCILEDSWLSRFILGKFERIKYFYYVFIKRFILTVKDMIKDLIKYDNRNTTLYLFWWSYQVRHVPIIAKDIFYGYISINGQMCINDPDELVSSIYYLNPSQKWLSNKIKEWTKKTREYKFEQECLEEFLTWKQKVESQGLKIIYLCSLDT